MNSHNKINIEFLQKLSIQIPFCDEARFSSLLNKRFLPCIALQFSSVALMVYLVSILLRGWGGCFVLVLSLKYEEKEDKNKISSPAQHQVVIF